MHIIMRNIFESERKKKIPKDINYIIIAILVVFG